MKKAGKFFFSLFIIIAAAAAVFFIGWIQFYVKPGKCGIMKSKTGGVYEKPIISGQFLWRWERLLPTNVQIETYSLNPYSATKSYKGSLPSAQVYAKMVEPKPGFDYDLQLNMTVMISPEGIHSLVSENKVKSQEELDAYLDSKVDFACKKLCEKLVQEKLPYVTEKTFTEDEISAFVSSYSSDLKYIDIVSVKVLKAQLPDIEVYETAKRLFQEYETELSNNMKDQAKKQAASILEEDRTMTQLEKFGKLLQQYPELQDISKSGDITVIMNTLRNLR